MFIGRWTVVGEEERFVETCRWYAERRSVVLCDSEYKAADGLQRGVSVIGHDEVAGHYTYYRYDDRGRTRAQRGWFGDDGVLRFTGERTVQGRNAREQVAIRTHERGFTLVAQRSVEGGEWRTTSEVEYRRLP